MHHAGGSFNSEEPECVEGATLGGPVHTGEPDDGPDADADNPEGEPDDVAQDVADEEGGSTISGSSLHSEVPHLRHDGVWKPITVRSGAMRQRLDPDSVVDKGYV